MLAGADVLADRLEQTQADHVGLLALTIDERASVLGQREEPPDGLAELRAREHVGDNGGRVAAVTQYTRSVKPASACPTSAASVVAGSSRSVASSDANECRSEMP